MTELRNLLATVLLLVLGVVMATDGPRYTVVRTEDTLKPATFPLRQSSARRPDKPWIVAKRWWRRLVHPF